MHASGDAPSVLHGLTEPERSSPVLTLDGRAPLKLAGGLLFEICTGRPLNPAKDADVRNYRHACAAVLLLLFHSSPLILTILTPFFPSPMQFQAIKDAVNGCHELAWVIWGLLRHWPPFPLEKLDEVRDLWIFADDPWTSLASKTSSIANIESNMRGCVSFCHSR